LKNKGYRSNTNEVELSSYLTPANFNEVKKTLVFLHGLFGSSNNWRYLSYSEAVRNRRNSLLIDLRNHGESDHHDSMTYNQMADDVIRHLDKLKIEKFTLLGHSMGAKTSMHIATKVKDRLDGLIIVDAAPKCHKDNKNIYGNTKAIVDAVSTFDLNDKTRRQVVDKFRENFVNIIKENQIFKRFYFLIFREDLLLIY
jgi:esterase